MAEWDAMLSSIVFTRIKNEFSSKIKTKYNMTNENFSTVGSSDTPAVFPFVYIQELESPEIGRTSEGEETNGIKYGVQIDVTDNRSQGNAKSVADELRHIMKKMKFKCTHPIPFNSSGNVHRYVIRCERTIGNGDVL